MGDWANVSLSHWGVIQSSHSEPRGDSDEKGLFAEKRLLIKRDSAGSGRPVLSRPPFLSWNKAELTGGGGEKARRLYKKRGQRLFGHLHLRHRRVEVFNGSMRLERGGVGEVVLILPRGPSLLGHPLLSFKPCSDLMSKYIQTVLRSRWTAVHTWHQNASELSQVITCDWIFASHLLLSVGKLQLHRNRENTHYTLSCLAVLNQLRLGHLCSQFGVQSQLYLELSTSGQDAF